MKIESTITTKVGQVSPVIYQEGLDPLTNLEGKEPTSVHAYCFCKDKMVLVYKEKGKSWTSPGGGIEPGETFEEAVIREVKEEPNMKVLYQEFIGYQDIYEPDQIIRQTRSFCIVEPYGDFVSDPNGDITNCSH